jgi:hypothetical protein
METTSFSYIVTVNNYINRHELYYNNKANQKNATSMKIAMIMK